jgi:hypothetical protein
MTRKTVSLAGSRRQWSGSSNKLKLRMSWKTIAFIAVIAVAAVYVWNSFIGPKVGITA